MPNRFVCDVLKEMRKCNETRNFSYLPGLIEEAQTMVNRMEARLEDYADLMGSYENILTKKKIIRMQNDEIHKLRMEIEDLQCKKNEAESLKQGKKEREGPDASTV